MACCNNFNQRKRDHERLSGGDMAVDDGSWLAQELKKISFQEQQVALEEVHGVAKGLMETPACLQEKLSEMRAEATQLSRAKRRTFERAVFLRPSYYQDKFLLIFLRAERLDATQAARRVCQFFDNKIELFGDSKLAQDITLDDLADSTKDSLTSGWFHPLSENDATGRRIVMADGNRYSSNAWTSEVQYVWYQLMALCEEEEVQTKGIVVIVYCVGMQGLPRDLVEFILKGGAMMDNIPIRYSGFHLCYDNMSIRPLLAALRQTARPETRVRYRFHYGSQLESLYALRSFGIRMNGGAFFSPDQIRSFIDERRRLETSHLGQLDTGCAVAYPQLLDVLVGRGRCYQDYSGNIKFSDIVKGFSEVYGSKKERVRKSIVAIEVIRQIHASGSRFLVRSNDGWNSCEEIVVREKVSQALRMQHKRSNVYTTSRLDEMEIHPREVSPVDTVP